VIRDVVMRHAFTVDVEDWFDGIPISPEQKRHAERRLHRGLDYLLEALARHNTRGTFFLLGPIAAEYPALVRKLAAAGHELGCHGWSHDLIYTMTRERFREETRRAAATIEDLAAQPVRAYRAAYFSITRPALWALDVLAELGFRYDSSIFPVRNWRYGIEDFDPSPQVVATPSGPIYEFPLSIRRIAGQSFPACGGAYFRIYPYWLTRSNMRAAERRGHPAIFYLHPWELDADHPRVPFYWKAHLTHYVNLGATRSRLSRLLDDFAFGPLGEVLDHEFA
jgi:polysaccharide deacetylase family protein (PEP-CTERM system associated)